MPRAPKEYTEFDRLMRRLLKVSKPDLDARVQAAKKRAALKPNKRGPKPKSSASRDPA